MEYFLMNSLSLSLSLSLEAILRHAAPGDLSGDLLP
jgi:hypothetical protein